MAAISLWFVVFFCGVNLGLGIGIGLSLDMGVGLTLAVAQVLGMSLQSRKKLMG